MCIVNREGIQFVMNTHSYPFLEILCEFSGKLMKQDKKVVCVDFIVSFSLKTYALFSVSCSSLDVKLCSADTCTCSVL